MDLFKVCLLVGFCSASQNSLPSFKWDNTFRSSTGVPKLFIDAPGGDQFVVQLHRYNPIPRSNDNSAIDNCTFLGTLEEDPGSVIALAGGCPFESSFEIMIHSEKLEGHMFRVRNNSVEAILPRQGFHCRHADKTGLRNLFGNKSTTQTGLPANKVSFPPNGFRMTIKMWYDQRFKNQWGADSINVLRRVMTFAQAMFLWPSLGTKIYLDVVEEEELQTSFEDGASSSSLNTFEKFVTNKTINANVLLTYDNNKIGAVGIAWTGTICNYNPKDRISVNEWFRSDTLTGEIVAHEIGHNLDMKHDFLDNDLQAPMVDDEGQTCKNVGGVMDYHQEKIVRWSTCSAEAFKAFYSQKIQGGTKFCLATATKADILGPLPTTTTLRRSTSSNGSSKSTLTTPLPTRTRPLQTTWRITGTSTSGTRQSTANTSIWMSTSAHPLASTTRSTLVGGSTTSSQTQSNEQKCRTMGKPCMTPCLLLGYSPIFTCHLVSEHISCKCSIFKSGSSQ